MKKNIYMAIIAGVVILLLAKFVFMGEALKMFAGICYGFGSACFALGWQSCQLIYCF